MRRLLLLRHAKSDWPADVADLERPLAARGRAEAPAIGAFMAREELRPDLALVSPARRTRQTWTLIASALGDPPHEVEPRLYMATADTLLGLVRKTRGNVRTLLLLGHNPGLEELARGLSNRGDKSALKQLAAAYPTSGLAVIDFAVADWGKIKELTGTLRHFVTPRSLGARHK